MRELARFEPVQHALGLPQPAGSLGPPVEIGNCAARIAAHGNQRSAEMQIAITYCVR